MSLGQTRRIFKDHSLHPKKNYGQHFLTDGHVLDKILAACELDKNCLALEIGPGAGALTVKLAAAAGTVRAVEIDAGLLPVLEKALEGFGNAEIIRGDILKTDVSAIIKEAGMDRTVIAANLPYYIASAVLVKLLTDKCPVERIVAMVQKEVAERIAAGPGSKNYGSLSVLAAYHSETRLVANVPRNAFWPKPTVDSAVIQLKILQEPPVTVRDERLFFKMIRAAFFWRRKTFVNCMANGAVFDLSKAELEAVLHKKNLPPQIRGEDMGLDDFAAVFNAVV